MLLSLIPNFRSGVETGPTYWVLSLGKSGHISPMVTISITAEVFAAIEASLDPCGGRDLRPRYEITVDNLAGVSRGVCFAELDRIEIAERPLRLRIADDGAVNRLRVRLG
jgi:hypothetical protein